MAGISPYANTATTTTKAGLTPYSNTEGTGVVTPVEEVDLTEEEVALRDNPFQYLDDSLDLMGTAVDLPEPNTTMYEDITNEAEGLGGFTGREDTFAKAQTRYDFYENHPDSTTNWLGEVVYKNKIVPKPEQGYFTGDMDVGFQSKVAKGIQNAGVNVLETGEMITDLTGVTDPNTSYIKDNFPKTSTGDSTLDSVVVEGAGLLTGGGALAKGTGWLISKVPAVAKIPFVKTIAVALGFEVGAASSMESDAGTLLIGNKSFLKELGYQPAILEGMEVNPEDPLAEQELAKRMNLLMDGLTASKIAEGAIGGIDFVARTVYNIFVDPLAKLGSVSRMEEDFMRDLLDELINVGDDPKAIEAARERIISLIDNNKDLYVDLPADLAETVSISVDSMTALERSLRDNNTDAAREIIMKARGKKQGVIATSAGTNQTAVAVDGPTNALEDVTNQAEVNLGGQEVIVAANRAIQDQGVAVVDDAQAAVLRAEGNLADLNTQVVRDLTEDPSVIGQVTDLEARTGFDIGSLRENSADEIVANLSKASEAMDNQKNELFALIEGGGVDYDDLVSTLRGLKPEQLDAAAAAMPGNSQFGTLLEQIKLQSKVVDDVVVKETTEEMQIRFAAWASENGLDFARLFTDIRPGIVDSINSLELGSAAEKGAAKTLIQFKKWIDEDAIKFLEDAGDDEALDAARTAMAYFKDEWAPFWDDGSTLQQIGTLRRQTTARGKQGARFEDEARGLVKGAIGDDTRSVAANMVRLLDRPDAGKNAGLVTDFIIGDVLSQLSTKLDTTEKVSELGLDAIRQGLSRYSTLIRKNFGAEADRLDALVEKLSNTNLTKEQLQRELVQAQRLADEAKNKIYTQELNQFFSANGVPKPNGYETMAKIFSNPQSSDQLTKLIAMAGDNPVIKDGMQAAYTRWFRNNFLGTTRSASGGRVMKVGQEMLNSEQVKNAFDYADIVFADRPEFVQALDTLLTETGLVQRSRSAKAIPSGSGTAELTDQIAAVNRGITATLGVLSRVGARIRATAVGALRNNFNKDVYFNMVDNLMANPDEFIRVAKSVVSTQKAVGKIPIRIPGTAGKRIPDAVPFLGGKDPTYYLDRGALYTMMVRAGVYREGNSEDERSFYEILAQTELDFTKASNEMIQSQQLGIK